MGRQIRFAAPLAALLFWMFTAVMGRAQQSQYAKNAATPKQVAQRGNASPPRSASACRDLNLIAATVDRRFDGENDDVLAAIGGGDKLEVADRPDSLWDRLVDCAHETKNTAQKVEALRVLAMWEEIRAENLQSSTTLRSRFGRPNVLTWIGSMAS